MLLTNIGVEAFQIIPRSEFLKTNRMEILLSRGLQIVYYLTADSLPFNH